MVTINPYAAYSALSGKNNTGMMPTKSATEHFGEAVKQAFVETVDAQRRAEAMTLASASGENVPMHEVIQAVSRAEMTLQTMTTMRDRAVEAYQEIMRMPI